MNSPFKFAVLITLLSFIAGFFGGVLGSEMCVVSSVSIIGGGIIYTLASQNK